MPFYIRKSVSVGPLRFNLSKGGIGVSAGVKGFRVGTGPRGHYVHAGRGGLYYRASLGNHGSGQSFTDNPHHLVPQDQTPSPRRRIKQLDPNIEMIEISSSDVLEMTDARYADLLAELNEKHASMSLENVLGGTGIVLTILLAFAIGLTALLVGAVLTVVATLYGKRRDAIRRSVVVIYDLESAATAVYERLVEAFDLLNGASRIWRIDAGGQVRDTTTWKRNAGASTIVDRKPTSFGYALPSVLKANITPPMMKAGKETLYFLPDVLLVVNAGKIGAVPYDKLEIRFENTRMIESTTLPRDAVQVGETWQHPNRNGGPDRRFSNNRRLPIALYETVHFKSENGLNEVFEFSVVGSAQPFKGAIASLASTITHKHKQEKTAWLQG